MLNTAITFVSAAFAGAILYFGIRWAINVEWEIVRANLRNFMIGQFPKDELWRPWAGGLTLVAAVGLGSAGMARTSFDDATEKGLPQSDRHGRRCCAASGRSSHSSSSC